MNIGRLSAAQLRAVYRERMVRDFPDDELKPLSMIEQALRRGAYECAAMFDGDEILAYAFFVILRRDGLQYWLFDYYAVREDLRDSGVGSSFMRALAQYHLRSASCVLLEVDNPDTASDQSERALRLRRERFYLRNGLLRTGVRAYVFGVDYRLLELPVNGAHTSGEVAQIYSDIYRSQLTKELFDTMVRVSAEAEQ